MNTPRQLLVQLARIELTQIRGKWWRHSSTAVPPGEFLRGSTSGGGRWSVRDGDPVLYLGRPRASVAVEAYRHLVDGTEGQDSRFVKPRRWLRVEVHVHRVLDLTIEANRASVGLDADDLYSDVGNYNRCQEVARAVAQLGNITAIMAPAATRHGETLAINPRLIELHDAIELLDDEVAPLPPDPRTAPVDVHQDLDAPAD